MRKTLPAIVFALLLSGCSSFQQVRGLPPRETPEPEPVRKAPDAPSPPDAAGGQTLKVDPGFSGINTNGTQAERDALMARKKQYIFSLKGEDKPVRSIQGSNPVETEELNKIYDELDKDKSSGSSVFKFY